MIQQAIKTVMDGKDLDFCTAKETMNEIMEGKTTNAQMGAFLAALRMKGESVDEITAFATVMREKGVKINPVRDVIDIVGTGGDGVGTFNISTTSAFVVAAGGVPVAKHGGRSVSSKSGAADVLEQLGINIDIPPARSQEILELCNLCFMFAPKYHSSMKFAAPVRMEMGVRTVFNILGPLSNPAGSTMQLMGVYDKKLVEPLASVLSKLGVTRGLVVCGDGIDEITLTGETSVCEIRDGTTKSYIITPEQFGFERCKIEDLIGGDSFENAKITKRILLGQELGAKRDIVILNAAMALYLGIDDCTVEDCIELATRLIDTNQAYSKLETLKKLTNEVAE